MAKKKKVIKKKAVKKSAPKKPAVTLKKAATLKKAHPKKPAPSKVGKSKVTVPETAPEQNASPMEKIKQSFSEGVAKGRRALLRKLMQVNGVDTQEIQKLYSTGLMEPKLLEDLSLADMVKSSGIGMNFARTVKEVVLRKDADLPLEYQNIEIDRLKKETNNIHGESNNVRSEIEQLNKKFNTLQGELQQALNEKNKHESALNKLKEEEKSYYFNEKRIQNELMFILKEKKAFKDEYDAHSENRQKSEKELTSLKREFQFSKGECKYILEKIDYLVKKLDSVVKLRGVSQNRLSTFLTELRHIHNTLVDAYKKTSSEYYSGKQ